MPTTMNPGALTVASVTFHRINHTLRYLRYGSDRFVVDLYDRSRYQMVYANSFDSDTAGWDAFCEKGKEMSALDTPAATARCGANNGHKRDGATQHGECQNRVTSGGYCHLHEEG